MDTTHPPASPSPQATFTLLPPPLTSIPILLILTLTPLLIYSLRRPSLPKLSPAIHRAAPSYPLLGHTGFFSSRTPFVLSGLRASLSNAFSFYFGPLHIVAVSGLAGRRAFFESKDMSFSEGYAVLYANTPTGTSNAEATKRGNEWSRWFQKHLIALMRRENMERLIPQLSKDTVAALKDIVARTGMKGEGMVDPFHDVYRLVYQLTMRTVGATEICEDAALREKTLRLFETIESASSPARIIFPWLPTPALLKRTAAGARLYGVLRKVVQARETEGRREEDALQFMLDSGEKDLTKLLKFIISSLFAGQINSGMASGWLLLYLGADPEWYGKIQAEVDAAIAKYRTSPAQSRMEVLSTLTFDDWESSFTLIDLALRETIRLTLVGTAFRKNASDQPVPLGDPAQKGASDTEVIPPAAFAIYLTDDVMMNPEIYPEPYRFDPGRYLPGREEDKKVPLAYLGWGMGKHPCLGMRFAKLEMQIIIAFWVAMFEFETVDVEGRKRDAPRVNRGYHQMSRPDEDVRVKYRLREP